MAKYILVLVILLSFSAVSSVSAYTNHWSDEFVPVGGIATPSQRYPISWEPGIPIYYYLDQTFKNQSPRWQIKLKEAVDDWNQYLRINKGQQLLEIPDRSNASIILNAVDINSSPLLLCARMKLNDCRGILGVTFYKDPNYVPEPLVEAVKTSTVSVPVPESQSSATIADGTNLNWNHTTGSCSDRLLLVGIASRRGNSGMTSVTYGGTSLTNIRSDTKGVDVRSELWYLVNPLEGTFPIQISSSVANSITAGASTFCNVSQSTPISANAGGYNTAAGTAASVQLTSNTGELAVDVVATQAVGAKVTVGSGQAQLWNRQGTWNNGAVSSKPGSGSTTMSWTLGIPEYWAISAVSLKPATDQIVTATPVPAIPVVSPTPTPVTTTLPSPTPEPTVMYPSDLAGSPSPEPTAQACINCPVPPPGCNWEGGSCVSCGTLLCPTPTPNPTPTPIPCSVTSASWGSPASSVLEGTAVSLNVTLSGDCNTQQVTFEVRRNVTVLPDQSIYTISAPVPGNNTASVPWTTSWTNGCLIGSCDPQYFFNAWVVGAGNAVVRSSDPLLTVTPIIVPVPSPSPSPTPVTTPTPTLTPVPIPTNTPTIVGRSIIKIYAAGTPSEGTYPNMRLRINNKDVKSFNNIKGNPNTRNFQEFVYTHPTKVISSQVRVRFTNDEGISDETGEDRDLRVDRINIDGVDYQSESPSTYSTGSWDATNGCSAGRKQTEWLQCNGYFEYR